MSVYDEPLDDEFNTWLDSVDRLCRRFAGCPLGDIGGYCDVMGYFSNGFSPGEFFAEDIVPLIEGEFGVENLPESIAATMLWGGEVQIMF